MTSFSTPNYELERFLQKGKNKEVIGLVKDELDGKRMTEFSTLRLRKYSYLIDDGDGNKKARFTKNVHHKPNT